jgi:hypothetical protein
MAELQPWFLPWDSAGRARPE